MIRAVILENGALKITADNESRKDLAYHYNDKYGQGYYGAEGEVVDQLRWHQNFEFVSPEWVAALTSSPIITDDLSLADDGGVIHVGDVWWFPAYMITDPWEELKNKGRVLFEPEIHNKTLPKSIF